MGFHHETLLLWTMGCQSPGYSLTHLLCARPPWAHHGSKVHPAPHGGLFGTGSPVSPVPASTRGALLLFARDGLASVGGTHGTPWLDHARLARGTKDELLFSGVATQAAFTTREAATMNDERDAQIETLSRCIDIMIAIRKALAGGEGLSPGLLYEGMDKAGKASLLCFDLKTKEKAP